MKRPTWAKWITRASLVLGAAALIWTLHDVGLRTFVHFFKLIGVFWIAVLAFETAITALDATLGEAKANSLRISAANYGVAQRAWPASERSCGNWQRWRLSVRPMSFVLTRRGLSRGVK